jgi:hypothetical protein
MFRRTRSLCSGRIYDIAENNIRNLKFNEDTLKRFEVKYQTGKQNVGWPSFKFKQGHDNASILIPLCTYKGVASVLFTVRNGKMRKHAGEVRYLLKYGLIKFSRGQAGHWRKRFGCGTSGNKGGNWSR